MNINEIREITKIAYSKRNKELSRRKERNSKRFIKKLERKIKRASKRGDSFVHLITKKYKLVCPHFVEEHFKEQGFMINHYYDTVFEHTKYSIFWY